MKYFYNFTEVDTKSDINSGICDNASDSEGEVCDRNKDILDVDEKCSVSYRDFCSKFLDNTAVKPMVTERSKSLQV